MSFFEERLSTLLSGHSIPELTKAYQELSKRYHQPNYKPGFQSALEVKAYAAARMPATFAAITRALSELPEDFIPKKIIDLGAGTGAGSLAVLEFFSDLQTLTLVEQDAVALQVAKMLLERESTPTFVYHYQNLQEFKLKEEVDLILLSYVLNELTEPEQQDILKNLLESRSRFILILMPGTPRCYRQLMKLRTFAITSGYFISAPCPHQFACPLEQIEGDWCHFSVRLPRTRHHQQFKEAPLNFEDEKYCYLLLSKDVPTTNEARLIKKPIHRSGHSLLDICEAGQVRRLTITRKDKDLYKAAVKAEWGDKLTRS